MKLLDGRIKDVSFWWYIHMDIKLKLNKSNRSIRLLIYIYLGYLMLTTVLTELQLMVIGDVVLKNSYIVFLTLPLLFLKIFIDCIVVGKLKRKYLVVFLFSIFIFFECIYYLLSGKSDVATIASFLFSKAMPIMIVMLISLQRKDIQMEGLFKFIEGIAFVNAVVVIIQYATNNILWNYLVDNDGNSLFWSIYSSDFSRLRPPGIMNSALSAGYISLIWLSVVLYQYQNVKVKKSTVVVKCILCVFSIFATQTRNIYFATFFIVIYTLVALKLKSKSRIFMPIFSLVSSVSYFLLFSVIGLSATSKEGIFSAASSVIRWMNWSSLWLKFQEQNILEKLFGTMKWQAIAIEEIFSDSLYFDLVFSIGIIGLILYIAINFKMQEKLCTVNEKTVIIAPMVASLLFIGIANIPSGCYESTILIMSALIINRNDYKQEDKERERLNVRQKNKKSSF